MMLDHLFKYSIFSIQPQVYSECVQVYSGSTGTSSSVQQHVTCSGSQPVQLSGGVQVTWTGQVWPLTVINMTCEWQSTWLLEKCLFFQWTNIFTRETLQIWRWIDSLFIVYTSLALPSLLWLQCMFMNIQQHYLH